VDRGVQDDRLQLVAGEQPVAANGCVLRGHRLERAAAEVAGEDDVHHVLGHDAPLGRDRVDDRDRALERDLVGDPDLLAKLPMQRRDQALAGVDIKLSAKLVKAAGA